MIYATMAFIACMVTYGKGTWITTHQSRLHFLRIVVLKMSFFAFPQTGYTNAPVVVAANASILGGKRISTSKKIIIFWCPPSPEYTHCLVYTVTLAFSLLSMVVAGVGMAGVIRKDRRLLGWYCLWLWPCFALLCAIGYLGYKQDTWNLSAKLGMQWRYNLSSNARIALQNTVSWLSHL